MDNTSTKTEPTTLTSGSDSEDDNPCTDYNNPAKSTTQNDERTTQGGPLIGKPSSIDYNKYQKHLVGAPVEVVKKTFKNTTQLG